MANITVTFFSNGITVKVPQELHDEFESCFPNAEWDWQLELWKIDVQHLKLLQQWIMEVHSASLIEAIDEHELAFKHHFDVSDLHHRLEMVKLDTERYTEASALLMQKCQSVEEMRKHLSGFIEALEDMKADALKRKANKHDTLTDVETMLKSFEVDIVHDAVKLLYESSNNADYRLAKLINHREI